MPPRAITASTGAGYLTDITAGEHRVIVDEPVADGGGNKGPTPIDLLLASLASCTTITVRMYADRKGYALRRVEAVATRPDAPPGPIPQISMKLTLEGDLDEEQRRRLVEIAHRCPVHRTLSAGCKVEIVH